MLKIRDGIDLKELEKYGAKFYYNTHDGKVDEIWFVDEKYEGTTWWSKLKFKKTIIKEGLFFKKTNEIFLLEPVEKANFYHNTDLIYDLIKADLVEKVSDE